MKTDDNKDDADHGLLEALAAHLPSLPEPVRHAYERLLGASTTEPQACERWREAARVCSGIPLEILTGMSTGSAQGVLAHLTAPEGELSRRWNDHLRNRTR